MTRVDHQQMAPHAENMVNVTRRHINSRSDFDHDYIGHYSSKAERRGHTHRITGRPMVRPQTQDYWSRPVQWTIGPDRFDDFLNGPRPV